MSELRLYAEPWNDYELIDAGGGKKLERWGDVITIRPEVQAYFKSGKPFQEWYELAHWEFSEKKNGSGSWHRTAKNAPERWDIGYKRLRFELEPGRFKHVGLFPEQVANWEFISKQLAPEERFLNLFAYTGAASLVARNTGAETLHVDSVKQLITRARHNMELSSLLNIKWVLEDALKFAQREQKRGNRYKGIIMDPPAWGSGANGEKWKLEEQLPVLLQAAAAILDPDGFLILNTYSPAVSLTDIATLADRFFAGRTRTLNELWMRSTTGKELYFGNLLRIHAK